jgi:hypothetical protein
MDAIYPCVAGLDVHKQTVVACVRRLDGRGRVSKQVNTFGSMTRDLLVLGDWLSRQGVTHVAMESTGVYWKPVCRRRATRSVIRVSVFFQTRGMPFLSLMVLYAESLPCGAPLPTA